MSDIPKRLEREKTQAVMIDMQERLLPAMERQAEVREKTEMLLRGLQILEIPVTVTQQYTRGLGPTEERLREAAGTEAYVEKLSFSCFLEPAFREALEAHPGRKAVLLFGVETHVCVLQTVLDLLASGRDVFVVCDCVDSRCRSDREVALRRMEAAGTVLTTAESALFELLGRAGSDTFRSISKLVK
ncbi:MAG: isochorismatase family protein [Lachnospiraceae bacterium]|nr:isochorismatase family protein [Lachnospiraceae bacterium]